ncbi:MAG: hypothetical protein ACI89X_001352 [Planctomycetota bacterium]|jgi:hypothetical protein
MLPATDTIAVPMPARGKYHMYFLVTHRERNGSSSSTAHIDSEVVEIGENQDLKLEFVLKEAVIARLREMLK